MKFYFALCALVIALSAASCAQTIGNVVGAERACMAAARH